MGAADALQQQAGDFRLSVKLALGHPQLLLRLSEEKQRSIRRKKKHLGTKHLVDKSASTWLVLRGAKPSTVAIKSCRLSENDEGSGMEEKRQ